MRALTIRQPLASLIALGVKTIETRGYGTPCRGPLVIHAGKAKPTDLDVGDWQVNPDGAGGWSVRHWPTAKKAGPGQNILATLFPAQLGKEYGYHVLPLGAVVAVVDLVDVVPIVDDWPLDTVAYVRREQRNVAEWWLYNDETGRCADVTGQEPYGDFTPGRYAWLLDNVRVIDPPIPAKGKLGPWRPDPDLRLEVSKAAHLAEVTR